MILDVDRKAFGDKLVLSNIHLQVENSGARYIIEGPSGCGKTTLMRIIAGLDKDYSGKMMDPIEEPVVLFQENRLVECLSVEANLRAVTDDIDRISYVLDSLAMGNELRSPVCTLSGGMKRRAAIARALLSCYGSLLLDEPFSGLDEDLADRVSEFILNEAGERLIIVISHDMADQERFCARPIILMKEHIYE